jgi:hypothetical protein
VRVEPSGSLHEATIITWQKPSEYTNRPHSRWLDLPTPQLHSESVLCPYTVYRRSDELRCLEAESRYLLALPIQFAAQRPGSHYCSLMIHWNSTLPFPAYPARPQTGTCLPGRVWYSGPYPATPHPPRVPSLLLPKSPSCLKCGVCSDHRIIDWCVRLCAIVCLCSPVYCGSMWCARVAYNKC